MTVQVVSNDLKKIGTCPHGNPAGACPICNGGGGGMKSSKDVRRNPGEMTWNECYALGLILKQRALEKQHALQQAQANQALSQQNRMFAKAAAALSSFNAAISASLAKLTQNIKNRDFKNIFNDMKAGFKAAAQNISNAIKTAIQTVKEKLADVSDKIAAMLGEMKNAIEKNIADGMKNMLKKLTSLFGFAKSESTTNESEENSERERLLKYKQVNRKDFSQENMQENEDDNNNPQQNEQKEQSEE